MTNQQTAWTIEQTRTEFQTQIDQGLVAMTGPDADGWTCFTATPDWLATGKAFKGTIRINERLQQSEYVRS